MKRKLLSLMLASALVVTCVFSAGTIAQAGNNTYTDSGSYDGDTATQDGVDANPTANQTSIDVQAQVTGGGDVVYSVKISWGQMQFVYDYGSTWDPTTHTYLTSSSGSQAGGWVTTGYLDGSNNKISITNDSNYPIDANFSYTNTNSTQFNASQTATSVAGIFDDSNSDLTNTVTANNVDTRTLVAPTLHLNTCTANLSPGTTYYYQDTDNGTYQGNVFFSLIGKPDRGNTALRAMQSVGTIKVTITPATGTLSKTKL